MSVCLCVCVCIQDTGLSRGVEELGRSWCGIQTSRAGISNHLQSQTFTCNPCFYWTVATCAGTADPAPSGGGSFHSTAVNKSLVRVHGCGKNSQETVAFTCDLWRVWIGEPNQLHHHCCGTEWRRQRGGLTDKLTWYHWIRIGLHLNQYVSKNNFLSDWRKHKTELCMRFQFLKVA